MSFLCVSSYNIHAYIRNKPRSYVRETRREIRWDKKITDSNGHKHCINILIVDGSFKSFYSVFSLGLALIVVTKNKNSIMPERMENFQVLAPNLNYVKEECFTFSFEIKKSRRLIMTKSKLHHLYQGLLF